MSEAPLGPRFQHAASRSRSTDCSKLADAARLEHLRGWHVAHYRYEAAQPAREMFGAPGVGWFRRLSAEHDDLRAALERCAADGGPREDGSTIVARCSTTG